MPSFHYNAYDDRGVLAKGSIDALSAEAARDVLWAQGLTSFQVMSSERGRARWWQRELRAGPRGLRADLATLTRGFATLTSAEIPLDESLRILSEQAPSPGLRALVTDLREEVRNGAALSDALQRRPQIFPADYVSVIRAGEIGGTVSLVLEELAALLERRQNLRAEIKSALVYPAILVGLSCVSLAVIVDILMPSLAPVLAEGGKPVPTAIRFFLTMQANWAELLAGLVLVGGLGAWAISIVSRRPGMRSLFDRHKLRMPMLGTLLRQQDAARFARTLGTLLRAGVPLLQAATSACGTIGNRHLAAGVSQAIGQMQEGASFHRALQGKAELPAIALRMIGIGEEAGKLDRMLLTVAAMLEQQTQRRLDRFMTLLTPLLTVAIALLVGGLIMTVMNTILSINEIAVR
jgi:general secretion pathway protein F